uniref:Uncharacterized protein n=1 Tax=Rhizophora mucronata TaxID=61149 RepID=A0A2P2QAA2_RHIMU
MSPNISVFHTPRLPVDGHEAIKTTSSLAVSNFSRCNFNTALFLLEENESQYHTECKQKQLKGIHFHAT